MLIRSIGLIILAIPLMVGCGRSSSALPSRPLTAAVQLREKLNAMSVPERLAYIKQHPETVQAVAGGMAPMRRAKISRRG